MAKAQTRGVPEERFLNYFGMQRPPFGPPADPLDIFDCEQYSFLNERLDRATEQAGSLAVICGVDGSGKTTLLNRYVGNLPESTACARFDETCKTAKQFYSEILTQLGFDEISGTLREFRNITREFLIYQSSAGKPVLIVVDNAHLMKPSVLEQLRWISATRVRGKRILSVVLAGNCDLPRIMESPAMCNLEFDHRVEFNIRVYTESETDAYVWHCLNASGGADVAKFSNEARAMIYRYTGGIPGQINELCNAALAEGCVQENRVIHDKLVRVVADREKMLPHAVPMKNRGRRKTDKNYIGDAAAEQIEKQAGGGKAGSKKTGDTPEAGTEELAAELKKQKRATKKAQGNLRKAKVLIEELENQVFELQTSVATYVSDLTNLQAQLRAQTGQSDEENGQHDALLSIEVCKAGNRQQIMDIGRSQSRIMIGRAADSELCLGGSFVSRHHALVTISDDEIIIEDLKSFNGTIVNGTRISRRRIGPGDNIVIGDYELSVRPA